MLDPQKESGSGLLTLSYASCLNILTVDQTSIDQIIGFLSDPSMLLISNCLKTVMQLS
jgi:hypothetical protein